MLYLLVGCFFFFFKQKTAYEMRISDWSSDVCSSDLPGAAQEPLDYRAQGVGVAARGRGRRTILSLPLSPPPQKNRSAPSHSSPDTPVPAGMSRLASTCPVRASICRSSLASFSQVPCQSSPSAQVTPVT